MNDTEREILLRNIDWAKIDQIAFFLEHMEEEFGYIKPRDRDDLSEMATYLRKIQCGVMAPRKPSVESVGRHD